MTTEQTTMKKTTSTAKSNSGLQSCKKVSGETKEKITLNGSHIEQIRSGNSFLIVRVTRAI
jgi:hypothetical protein